MIPTVVGLAILFGFSTLIFRIILSHRPFRVGGGAQITLPFVLGVSLWILFSFLYIMQTQSLKDIGWDILCGTLIFLCAFWCHYWIGNLAGGFRVQMQIALVDQAAPITYREWMSKFDGRGMDAFLVDRMKSILILWKIVTIEKDTVQLTQGWGTFYGKLMNLLNIILPGLRNS
jgi:hypothetical protein